jgi:hypothetical protein
MTRKYKYLGLAMLFAVLCAGCDSCDYAAPTDSANAEFDVNFENLSTVPVNFTGPGFISPTITLQGGGTAITNRQLSGPNGATFTWSYSNSEASGTVTCTLQNAGDVMIFHRLVRFDTANKSAHCELWAGIGGTGD